MIGFFHFRVGITLLVPTQWKIFYDNEMTSYDNVADVLVSVPAFAGMNRIGVHEGRFTLREDL